MTDPARLAEGRAPHAEEEDMSGERDADLEARQIGAYLGAIRDILSAVESLCGRARDQFEEREGFELFENARLAVASLQDSSHAFAELARAAIPPSMLTAGGKRSLR